MARRGVTNRIVPFVCERDISKEQGLAAGVLSPLLPLSPLPLRPTFVGTPAMRARSFQPKACYSHKKGVCVYTSIGSGSSI